MRRVVLLAIGLFAAAAVGGAVWAAERVIHPHTGGADGISALPPVERDLPPAAGRIVAVDLAHARLTVEHRGIERFHVEPGTAVLQLEDPRLLRGHTRGDRIRFDVIVRVGKRYVVTRLENSN